jgi:enoyl-CoA hydratase/carnithine racemase
MTGELIGAEQALAWGLVDQVVEPDQLDSTALGLAKRLAAGPPLALAMAKQVIDNMWAGALRSTIRAELLAQSALFRSDDYQEARSARREGREPNYLGR